MIVKATYQVIYQSKDISKDLAPYLLSISYTDKTVGEADEFSMTVKNDDNRWMSSWQPLQGDTVTAQITSGNVTLPCGTFTVDSLSYSGSRESGSLLTIKSLGAGVKDAVRTKTSFAHEGKTLSQIASKIAGKYGYTVSGVIHDFSIARVTQMHETDLAFLHRIAEDFGYMFTLRGTTLVFTYLSDLNSRQSSLTINRSDCGQGWTIEDKVAGIYKAAHLRHYNSKLKKVFDNLKAAGANPSADTLEIRSNVDDDNQATYKAGGRLYKKNLEQTEMNVTSPGNVYLVSGNNATMNGWYNYDGIYMIGESTHAVDNENNYTTSANYKRVKP